MPACPGECPQVYTGGGLTYIWKILGRGLEANKISHKIIDTLGYKFIMLTPLAGALFSSCVSKHQTKV